MLYTLFYYFIVLILFIVFFKLVLTDKSARIFAQNGFKFKSTYISISEMKREINNLNNSVGGKRST